MDQEYKAKLDEAKQQREEILQQRIDNGEMINFCGFWISKHTYNVIIETCNKLASR